MRAEEVVKKMSTDEKIRILSGKNFWETLDLPDLGIRSVEVADGPCGLRKQKQNFDHLGFYESEPATACVSGPALAASFNKILFEQAGQMLGEECAAYGVDILLGPAVNIQKSPLCGRNFEYFSEDPVLAGKAAAGFIRGIQSMGVGACIKHFAANNQETEREYIDARIDERSLREIYLKVFEIAVKESSPWAVMTALNKINGKYASENEKLLNDVLRKEWGFEGFVMSDWWGVNDRALALKAGLDLEMPFSAGVGAAKLKAALEEGKITESELDISCIRLIRCALSLPEKKNEDGSFDIQKHHAMARKQAEESIVLIKNDGAALPLSSECRLAVIGEMAEIPRYRLEGSALVNPTMQDIPLKEIQKHCTLEVQYTAGYGSGGNLQEAVKIASGVDAVVIFAGLTQGMEAEGHDRKHLSLPEEQNILIREVAAANPNTIVVLANGGPVEMPWISQTAGVLECFLAGQAMGSAVADILFGTVNPSGKLPVTFPVSLAQVPDALEWPGNKEWQEYKEGVFVGYRYYEKKEIRPLFAFGHGLSYTTFQYGELCADLTGLQKGERSRFYLRVKNTGNRAGAEAVQLYVGMKERGKVIRPVKELKEFEKVYLQPGEEKEVCFELDWRAFSYYHEGLKDWYVEKGIYNIMAGSSSEDIRSQISVYIQPETELSEKITGWSGVSRFYETDAGRKAIQEMTELIKNGYCEDGLREMFLKQDFGDLKIRFLTLQTQTSLDNDRIERYLKRCNEEYVKRYQEKQISGKILLKVMRVHRDEMEQGEENADR